MTANPVHIGRILEHGPMWSWFRLDRVPAVQRGDRIRVRPVLDAVDYPFRIGECTVIGVMGVCVHVERAAWTDIAAIADGDHVYLTERPERDIGCGDHVRWHPTPESPWHDMIIEGIAERVYERADGTRRLTMLRVTAVHRGTSLLEYRPFALGSLVDVTVAPGTVEVLRHRPYAPGEKMTDRHPDSVIAQVVEETIAKQVEHLATPIKVRSPYAPLPPVGEPAFRLSERDGALFVDTAAGPVKITGDLAELRKSAPSTPGKQWVTPVVGEPGPAQRAAFTAAVSRAVVVQDLAQQSHITREQALSLMQAPQMPEPEHRPDGFDQHQVDAAKAALLAPAPPRYPRRTR